MRLLQQRQLAICCCAPLLRKLDLRGRLLDNHQGVVGAVRCMCRASDHGAVIQVSTSSRVVRIAGIAFSWIGAMRALGLVVRKP